MMWLLEVQHYHGSPLGGRLEDNLARQDSGHRKGDWNLRSRWNIEVFIYKPRRLYDAVVER